MRHRLQPVKGHEGLVECRTCKGWEGGLPSECPGHRISVDVQDAVFEGQMDFRDGGWQLKKLGGAIQHARMTLMDNARR